MTRLIPIAMHIYRGCIIGRNHNPAALKWSSYCDGTFLAADTLRGMKRLITDTLKG